MTAFGLFLDREVKQAGRRHWLCVGRCRDSVVHICEGEKRGTARLNSGPCGLWLTVVDRELLRSRIGEGPDKGDHPSEKRPAQQDRDRPDGSLVVVVAAVRDDPRSDPGDGSEGAGDQDNDSPGRGVRVRDRGGGGQHQ